MFSIGDLKLESVFIAIICILYRDPVLDEFKVLSFVVTVGRFFDWIPPHNSKQRILTATADVQVIILLIIYSVKKIGHAIFITSFNYSIIIVSYIYL